MDKVLVKYSNNKSAGYDGKNYWESLSKIRRTVGASGKLKIGENVAVKSKSRIWKAIVVSTEETTKPSPAKKKRRQTKAKASSNVPYRTESIMMSFPAAKSTPTTQDQASLNSSIESPILDSPRATSTSDPFNPHSPPNPDFFVTHHTTDSLTPHTIPITDSLSTSYTETATNSPTTSTADSFSLHTTPVTHSIPSYTSHTTDPKSLPLHTTPVTHPPIPHTPITTESLPLHTTPVTHSLASCTAPPTDSLIPLTTPTLQLGITPDFSLLNDIYPDPTELGVNRQSEELREIKMEMESIKHYMLQVSTQLENIENLLKAQPHMAVSRPCIPLGDINSPSTVNVLPNRQSLDRCAMSESENNARINAVLRDPKIKNAIQLGAELTKVLFTDEELASSSLTGRKVHGSAKQPLDPIRMHLLDTLVKQKYPHLCEAEFASVRGAIRVAIGNRCKYVRLKMASNNQTLI